MEDGTALGDTASQAFKRLHVNEEESAIPMEQSPIRTPPVEARALYHHHLNQEPLYGSKAAPPNNNNNNNKVRHYQSPGQDTMSEGHSTTTTTPTRTLNTTTQTDANYKTVNHFLGQLHQQRIQREVSVHMHSSLTTTTTNKQSSSTSTNPYDPIMPPPAPRRCQVKHLYTNSKLG